jgi:hypothetical protein
MVGVVAKQEPTKHTIQFEYTFDRLLDMKLAQVYDVLVPDKAWSTHEQHSETDGSRLNESGSDLCTRLIGPAERREEKTIASQTAALIEHAQQMDLTTPTEWIFEDEGYSGAVLVRPGLEQLRDLAATGQIAGNRGHRK